MCAYMFIYKYLDETIIDEEKQDSTMGKVLCLYLYACMYICICVSTRQQRHRSIPALSIYHILQQSVYVCIYIYVYIYIYMCRRCHKIKQSS